MSLALYHSGYVSPGLSKATPLLMFLDPSIIKDLNEVDQKHPLQLQDRQGRSMSDYFPCSSEYLRGICALSKLIGDRGIPGAAFRRAPYDGRGSRPMRGTRVTEFKH